MKVQNKKVKSLLREILNTEEDSYKKIYVYVGSRGLNFLYIRLLTIEFVIKFDLVFDVLIFIGYFIECKYFLYDKPTVDNCCKYLLGLEYDKEALVLHKLEIT